MMVKSRIYSLILCCSLLFGCFGAKVQATEPTDAVMQVAEPTAAPSFSHINFIALSLDVKSDGQVIIACTVSARDCTAIEQRLTLQWWDGSNWRNLPGASWVKRDQGTIGWFDDSSCRVSVGSYRVVNLVSIYDGSQIVEQFEHPSSVVIY